MLTETLRHLFTVCKMKGHLSTFRKWWTENWNIVWWMHMAMTYMEAKDGRSLSSNDFITVPTFWPHLVFLEMQFHAISLAKSIHLSSYKDKVSLWSSRIVRVSKALKRKGWHKLTAYTNSNLAATCATCSRPQIGHPFRKIYSRTFS